MDIVNDTPFADGLVMGMGPDRQPCLAVVVKATFELPARPGQAPEPAADPLPVLSEDEYYDGDVTGSVRVEADNVPFKPRTDVVVVGTAYAPGRRPVRALDATVRVGPMQKTVRVTGDRQWVFPSRMAVVPRITDPVPFTTMPLRYERAFGGVDHKAGQWCAENFVGRGFIGKKSRASVDGKRLPNLEDPRDRITSWDDRPRPVGFGFYRKDWQPRASHAGTPEGQAAADDAFGLPADFRHDFYNGAHPELQVPGYLQGGEPVRLENLTPEGECRFALPTVRPTVTVHRYTEPLPDDEDTAGDEPIDPEARETRAEPVEMSFDTLVFFPDEGLFYEVWRGRCALVDESLSDVASIAIQSANA